MQDHQTQIWFTVRCALRDLPGLGTWSEATNRTLAFSGCRALLLSTAAATCAKADMEAIKSASVDASTAGISAAAAASPALSVENKAIPKKASLDISLASAAAASSAAYNAAASVSDAARSAASYSAYSLSDKRASGAIYLASRQIWDAATLDANSPKNWKALWHGQPQPEYMLRAWNSLKGQWKADIADWAFWIKWYEAVLAGEWKDWNLIFQIAITLKAEDWEKGPAHVAEEIAAIEEKLKGQQRDEPRQPDFEPRSVERLFENRRTVCAGAATLSSVIREEFGAFIAETGLNQTPEPLLPLAAMPRILDKIVDLLSTRSRTDDTEQALREEVGRLKALVAELENKLSEAKDEIATHENNSWIRTAAKTIASAHVFGVVATTVWTISGDDVGPQNRWENIIEYRDFVIGEAEEDKTPSRRLPQIRSD